MEVFRIEKTKYLNSILQGIPGKQYSFRWNTRVHPIIYASMTKSLALYEKSANMSKPFHGYYPQYVIASVQLPDEKYKTILPQDLPRGWDKIDEYHPKTQEIGDRFVSSNELALLVPSTIVSGEFNVIINPNEALKLNLTVLTEQIDERLRDLR